MSAGPVPTRRNVGDALADVLLAAVRACFRYPPGENRATGVIYGDVPWPPSFATLGPALLDELGGDYVVFQAYRDGRAVTAEHSDAMPQRIVSLGATRRFVLDGQVLELTHGDVLDVAPGTPHEVPADPVVTGERCSLVFRTLKGNP